MPRLLDVAATAAALLVAACASGSGGPAVTPPPTTVPATPPGAPAPAPIPVRPYTSGSPTYVITTTASVRVEGDTTAVAAETVETTLLARMLLERAGSRLFVSGAIDSFTVRGSGRLNGAPLAGPVRFHGEGTTFGKLMTFVPDLPVSCDSPAEALVAVARDLIVPLPDRVTIGSTWRDTVTSTICRGGIPLTTTAVRQYEARALATYAGTEALELARTTELTVTGSGTQYGQSVSVTGQGSGSAALFVDLAGGGLVRSMGETTVMVTFMGPRGTTAFTQTAQQRVERR
jgi:hypothetical protein